MCCIAMMFVSVLSCVASVCLAWSYDGVVPVNVMFPVISFLWSSLFSFVLVMFMFIYVTLIAYSPAVVMPIFCAISDFCASMIAILPFQFCTNWLFLQFGHSCVSVSVLHLLHACFLLIFSSPFSFLVLVRVCFLVLSILACRVLTGAL